MTQTPFTLGERSLKNLKQVHPDVAAVCLRAIELSTQDFCIENGPRDKTTQLAVWRSGHSKLNGIPVGVTENGVEGTGLGNHQVGPDGFGHAVDATPWVNGKILWANRGLSDTEQWSYIYPVAWAFQQAAHEWGARIRWGGVWDRVLNDLPLNGPAALKAEVALYVIRHRGPDLLDGPHFELHK